MLTYIIPYSGLFVNHILIQIYFVLRQKVLNLVLGIKEFFKLFALD